MSNIIVETVSNSSTKKVILHFKNLGDMVRFKNECNCPDFYIDRDTTSIVGSFTREQLDLATEKYDVICRLESEVEKSGR